MSEVTKIEEVKDLTEEQNTPQVPEKQEIQEQSGKAGKAKKVVARDAQTFLNRVTLLAAFLLPFLAMLAILVFNGVYPFGTKTMLDSDMYHQYMPFLKEYVKMVRAGQSIDYSWKVGIGSNFLALYIYYLASPTNWLVFLVPEKFIIEFMSFFVIVKIGLAGFTSCLFLRSRATSEQNPVMVAYGSLVASVFYAMSGFMAAYNWNVMWLDCVVLFPLILIALHRLVFKGKMGLYVITLGLCIYTNFYISIMICLFLVIYFIYLFIMEKRSFSMVWKFALGSLLAGGL
ncbi:MAG: YfhO family protein, partial [Lachnospiraceae bacterium]|nr:YfhO family protein [Lachnospiraceae bacterium]